MRGAATKKYIYPTVPPEVYDYNLLEMLAACSFVSAAVRSIASSTFDIAPIDIPACICTLSWGTVLSFSWLVDAGYPWHRSRINKRNDTCAVTCIIIKHAHSRQILPQHALQPCYRQRIPPSCSILINGFNRFKSKEIKYTYKDSFSTKISPGSVIRSGSGCLPSSTRIFALPCTALTKAKR